jgi:hypothetical protein
MKLFIKQIIALLFFASLTQQAICQAEIFDIIHYTPPKDWLRESKEGVISFTNINEQAGTFCVIAIFASTASKGDLKKDFSSQWKELAVIPHKANPSPKTEKQDSPDGWKAMSAASPIKLEGVDCYLILTVFSGFGKKVSVLVSLNDSSYLSQVDALLEDMKLDKQSTVVKEPAVIPPKQTTVTQPKQTTAEKNLPIQNTVNTSTETFGHMIFTPMKDWKMQRYTNAIIFKPNYLPDNRYLETRIMESKPFSGTMQEALDVSWNDALLQFKTISPYTKPYSLITEKKSFKGWDYIQCEGTIRRNDAADDLSYDKYYINLFVIKLNNRIERIVTVGLKNINGADYSPYNSSLYSDPILGLCYSVQFDDWKEPAIGALKGQALSGMYEGFKLGGGSLNANYALFFPNGQVFFGGKFPTEGFDGKNTWVYAELNTRNWGTYTLQDGKGTINMGYGNVPLKVTGGGLIITTQNTPHNYEQLPSVDGVVFNGKYAFDGDWGGKPPSITFTKDGKFIDEGALNILNHQTTDPDEFNVTAKPGSGTYYIKTYTIVFKYSDGRTVQITFDGNGFDRKNPSPASLNLSFNNDIIYRK